MISIIIPAFNAEKTITRCISSIINQTYKEIEIILVDDGSSDTTLAIAKAFLQSDHRMRIIEQPNCGVSKARNVGLKTANGEFVMFVDSDDWIEPQTCSILIAQQRECNADIVLFSYCREYSENTKNTLLLGSEKKVWNEKDVLTIYRRIIGEVDEELQWPHKIDILVTVWGKLYKKDVLNDVLFEDITVVGSEDTLFNIEVFDKVHTVAYVPDILYHYWKGDEGSLTHRYKKELITRWKELYSRIQSKLDEISADDVFYSALNNRIALGLIGLGLNIAEDNQLNIFQKKKILRDLLEDEIYVNSLEQLQMKYMPIHWKFFFILAGKRYSGLLLAMLILMNRMRKA